MGTTHREIELKLELTPGTAEALAGLGVPEGFGRGKARTQRLRSIYFDTPDTALARARIAARVRLKGKTWIQTVKLPGDPAGSGLHTPREYEVKVPSAEFSLDAVPDEDVRAEIAAALGGQSLAPRFETVIERSQRDITAPDGSLVEVALDIGEIVAGPRRQPLQELELELKSGQIEGLYAIARALVGPLPFRFSALSKAERGDRLARGEDGVPAAHPALAEPVDLSSGLTAERAYHAILRSCSHQIAENRMACLAGDDPEGPHQLRVGLRRLRTALRLFRPLVNPRSTGALDAAAQRLALGIGRLRDLDVLSADIVAPLLAIAPERVDLARLDRHLDGLRAQRRQDVQALLVSQTVNDLLFDLASYTETRGWLSSEDIEQSERLAVPVAEFARSALDGQWRRVQKYGNRLDSLTIAERHDMRKALKKFRYGLEFFAGLTPKGERKSYLKRLKSLQDVFGYLNDVAMAEMLLDLPLPDGTAATDLAQAAGFVIGWHEAEARHAWQHAQDSWDEASRAPKYWR
ncbi:CHAD domain-containing protein [Microvirga tunisiensis]|uniref:CHAD domain-containing protein n=1 Tax=Pannonibacter tanglangensis TaxID=2750084 RepID=A0A7X5JAW2_9HYPH|nr:CHAD domain-containing protein [Pannonibacter sp. XCT-53]NBN80487.1 CHAD domain-containing protein [Pannonibacter sp. XCT-53]